MQKQGFSLLEILITLSIILILSGLFYAKYSNYSINVHRKNVEVSLFEISTKLEQFYMQNNFSYQGISLEKLTDVRMHENYYKINVESDVNSYNIVAIPINRQLENDKLCGTLSLDSNGNKNISGAGTIQDCW